jgi:hypothetical protein
LLLEDLTKPLLARLYVPVSSGYTVETNMPVQISPVNVNSSEFGFLQGHVVSAARFPITLQELAARLQNQDLAQQLATGGPKLQILVTLDSDSKATEGDNKASGTDGKASGTHRKVTGANNKATGTADKASGTDCKVGDVYKWSASAGPPPQLYSGTPCQGRIIVAQYGPIYLVFPSLAKYFPSLKK